MVDDTDLRLLAALRHDSRRSVSSLASELRLSRAAVRARMDRLQERGVILGYTVLVQGDRAVAPVRAMTTVEIEGRSTDATVRSLSGIPEVLAIHSTNGRWDLVLEIGAADLTSLDGVLRRIRLLPAIRTSETSLLLSTLHGGARTSMLA